MSLNYYPILSISGSHAALNALNDPLMREVNAALEKFEADPAIGAVIITGSEKAFAGEARKDTK